MQRFKNRVIKLENRNCKQGSNRVLHYNPADYTKEQTLSELTVWQTGCGRYIENPAIGQLKEFKGRFMLVSDFGADVEWIAANRKHQNELLESASEI
jgi:hypothetical protein